MFGFKLSVFFTGCSVAFTFRPEFFISCFTGFFSDLGREDEKNNKKALKMTSELVIFRAFFSFSELFLFFFLY